MSHSIPLAAAAPLPDLARPAALAVAVAAVIAIPAIVGGFPLQLAVTGGLMAAAAMTLTVLTGTAGLLSLAQGAFLSVGAFTAGVLATSFGLGILPALLIAAFFGLILGGGVALLTLRVSGIYLAVGTFAFHHVVEILTGDIEVKLTQATGFILTHPVLFGLTVDTPLKWWGLTVGVIALVFVALNFLRRSHIGREWTFLREDPSAAAALGISLLRSRATVFMLTSSITAAVGVLSAYQLGNVQAGNYSIHIAIAYLTIVALGRAGSLIGAIIASYVILLLPIPIEATLGLFGVDATSHIAGIENVLLGSILVFSLLNGPDRVLALIKGRLRHGRG